MHRYTHTRTLKRPNVISCTVFLFSSQSRTLTQSHVNTYTRDSYIPTFTLLQLAPRTFYPSNHTRTHTPKLTLNIHTHIFTSPIRSLTLNQHTHSYPHTHHHTNIHTHYYSYPHTHHHSNPHTHPHTNPHTHPHTEPHTHPQKNRTHHVILIIASEIQEIIKEGTLVSVTQLELQHTQHLAFEREEFCPCVRVQSQLEQV